MQKRVFLIHGWEGKPDNHWFPWLTLELKANGFEVSAPQMPHAGNPGVKEWLEFLKEYVGKPDKNTYFIGHSLGCITIARYLAKLSGITKIRNTPSASGISSSKEGERKKEKVKVGGCVFVAGFSGRINVPEISEFYLPPHQIQQKDGMSAKVEGKTSNTKAKELITNKIWCGGELPFDSEKAKAHCDKFVMIFSNNDPYVPMEKSLEMAKQLGAKTILERGKGHFTAGDGVTALPSVLSVLLKFAKQ